MLLARTEEYAMLGAFEPSELISFEDACPQKLEAVTREMQNQEKTCAMFLQM